MKLTVINSGSSGNGYVLQNSNEALILEAGCKLLDVKKTLNFNTYKVVGCMISHIHNDHSKYVSDYINNGIKVYSPHETQSKIFDACGELTIALNELKRYKIGNFTVTPFLVPHDRDIENYGYLIEHEEFGKLLFLTDLEYCPYNFSKQNVNHILVECNYSKELLSGNYIKSLRDRVLETHMELETCKKFIETNNNPNLINVLLLHLSDSNSDEKMFQSEIQSVTNANVQVANKGLKIDIEKYVF